MNPMHRLARQHRILALGVGLLGLGLALAAKVGWGGAPLWAFGLLVLAFVATEAAEIRFVVGAEVWSLSLTEVALGAALVMMPGGWVAIASGVAVSGWMTAQRNRPLKTFYNSAMYVLSMAVAVTVSHAAGASVLGASFGAATFAICNFLLVTAAVRMATRRPVRELVGMGGLIGVGQAMGSASVGILAGWLAIHAPLGLIGLIVPVALIWYSYRAQIRQAAESRMFSELASGHELIAGPSIDTSARVVVSAANRLLSGAAEIVIFTGETPVRYFADGGAVTSSRGSADLLSEAWVVEALGVDGLASGTVERAPYLVTRLGTPSAPSAVIRVLRPEHAPVFERRDQMMASILIGQAQSWFEIVEVSAARDEAIARAELSDAASRVIGDMGAETFPALIRLRESAVRLTWLANTATSRDGVGDIVEELHAAERAVASLLGAIALAADVQLENDNVVELPTGTSMGDDDWTTTGTLDLEAADGAL